MLAWHDNESDHLVAEELADFLPDTIYDMHMHVYRSADLHEPDSQLVNEGPDIVGINEVRHFYQRLFPRTRLSGGLAIAFPTKAGDRYAANAFVASQVEQNPDFRGSICLSPDDAPDDILEFLDSHVRISGLKPYHLYSRNQPTWDLPVSGFLPEWAWQIADARRLAITLHLVRADAVADVENQQDIRQMAEKYPNARLILAHAARCFHAPNAKKGLAALRELDNVWFDLSAICEPEPIREILVQYGPKRLFWGSDFPVSTIRGRVVTLGLGFIWLQEDTIVWDKLGTACRPVMVGLESLRALRTACTDLCLGKSDVAAICDGNAREFLRSK